MIHVGRHADDTEIENQCPCPQEPCGLVDIDRADPDCEHHKWGLTMKQGHNAKDCRGRKLP